MHYHRRRHFRNTYYYPDSEQDKLSLKARRRSAGGMLALLTLFFICIFLACAMTFLKELSSEIAVSDASDIVTMQINKVISEIMSEGEFSSEQFVSFVKNENGDITAINSNMARINALSAEILDRVVGTSGSRTITVSVPIGNLTGVSLLMGKGPGVPVDIIVLTSSKVAFDNCVSSAGINQTNQQINLKVTVDIDILIPWDTVNTQVVTEVLIADTVLVGRVPDTYLNMQK